MSDEPGDWESALISAGYVDGRGANRASWRRLAQEVGVHQTTLKYMRTGERDTDQATVAIQDDQTLAARHEREHGKMKTTDDAQKLAGEENQDDGGEDPA